MKRRSFIQKSAAASAAFTIVPSFVLGKAHVAPSDTLYINAVGVGGRGERVWLENSMKQAELNLSPCVMLMTNV